MLRLVVSNQVFPPALTPVIPELSETMEGTQHLNAPTPQRLNASTP